MKFKLKPSIQSLFSGLSKFFSFYSLPLLSGALIGTSYIPFPPYALFFCFIPLWIFALKHQKFGPLLKGGWICQFVMALIGFHWLIYTLKELILFSWPASFLAFLLFCSLANGHIPIALLFWLASKKLLSKTKKQVPFFFILLLFPLYFALTIKYYPMIFKWHLGYVWLYAKWPAAQTAEIWGFQFLHTLTLFFNLSLLIVFQNLKKGLFKNLALYRFGLSLPDSRWNLSPRFKSLALYRFGLRFSALVRPSLGKQNSGARRNIDKKRKNSNTPGIKEKRGNILFLFKKIFQKGDGPIRFGAFGFRRRLPALKGIDNKEKTKRDRHKKSPFLPLGSGVFLFVVINLYGLYLKQRWPEPDKKITVLIIQPNIENEKQEEEEWLEHILSKVLQETVKHLWIPNAKPGIRLEKQDSESMPAEQTNSSGYKYSMPADFILWPEGAYPYPVDKDKALNKADPIQKWASVFGAPLIASAKGRKGLENTNSVFAFDQNGRLIQAPYDKTMLMPVGEYIPLEKWLPSLGDLFFDEKTFTAGTGENKIINLDGTRLGLQICYESLFDGFTRDLAREGADVLINVTNDAWFGSWWEPWQHFYMTAARAIEVRRPLIRGTNSGISAVVSAKGEISSPWTLNQTLSWIQEVPYSKRNKRQSFFTDAGLYFNSLFLWLFLIFIHCFPLMPLERRP